MYERILVPTDGSAGADAAFEHAVTLARAAGATLHVINVVDPSLVPPEIGSESVLETFRESGEELVQQLRTEAEAAGLTVETAVVSGAPAERIRRYAVDHEADLVVMGTHGRTGIDYWLLGSVAERVVRTCPVPVLTVRRPRAEP